MLASGGGGEEQFNHRSYEARPTRCRVEPARVSSQLHGGGGGESKIKNVEGEVNSLSRGTGALDWRGGGCVDDIVRS